MLLLVDLKEKVSLGCKTCVKRFCFARYAKLAIVDER